MVTVVQFHHYLLNHFHIIRYLGYYQLSSIINHAGCNEQNNKHHSSFASQLVTLPSFLLDLLHQVKEDFKALGTFCKIALRTAALAALPAALRTCVSP